MRLLHAHLIKIITVCLVAATSFYTDVSAQPVISYIIPDIGTTRYATYVEIIGQYDKNGAFGTDGFYMNNQGDAFQVRCKRPADTNNVKIGPCIVSWNGRMVSTHIFVGPAAQPNSDDWTKLNSGFRIPIEVVVNGNVSNADTFYIVKPFAFGDRRGNTEQDLGAGSLGRRSRRGAMIIDSAILRSALDYRISINDCDPSTPGNQGYLPFVLMCVGNFTGNDAIIHASGNGSNGGPGGGGGAGAYANFNFGSNRGIDGGVGYTGGGPGGYNFTNTRNKPGVGTGGELATGTVGNISLNRQPGGTSTTAYENAGGGTGHPFGVSGMGCDNYTTCNPAGGYGGGSGGKENEQGGGGGYRTIGQDAFNAQNGGKVYGNDIIVPLAGGSGGASGNPSLPSRPVASAGGGGGGAVSIHARLLKRFEVRAYGSQPSKYDVLGGQGSSGGVILGSRIQNPVATDFYTISVGPMDPNGFSAGGEGRRRYDDRINNPGIPVGHLSDTTTIALRDFRLRGYGNGSDIDIYFKPENGPWQYGQTLTNYKGFDWQASFFLPGPDTLFYISVTQKVNNPKNGVYEQDPVRFMSQSAWNIVRIFGPPIIAAPKSSFMGNYKCPGDILSDTVIVENKGASPLIISNATWSGSPGFRLVTPASFPDTIKAYSQKNYIVEFSPTGPTGLLTSDLILDNNDTIQGSDPYIIRFSVNVKNLNVKYVWSGVEGDTLVILPVCVGKEFQNFITIVNMGDTVVVDSVKSSDPSVVIKVEQNLPATLPFATSTRVDPIAYRLGRTLVPILVYLNGCPMPDTVWMDFEGVDANMTLIGTGQFGSVPVGSTRQLTLQIRNDGSSDLEIPILPPGPNPPFRLVSTAPTPSLILKSGEVMNLIYEFAPTAPGPFTESFYVKSITNKSSCDDSVLIILAGEGAEVSVVAVPGSLTLAPTRSCDSLLDSVKIVNNGEVEVTLRYPAFINGANAADFVLVSQPRIDTTLPPGGSANYVVMFQPLQGPTSLRTALLEVRTDAPSVPRVEVPISGTSATIALNGPRVIDLALVPVGVPVSQTVTYTNMTGGDVEITQIRSSRPGVLSATPGSFTIANTATQDVDVTVIASSEESTTDTLWFVSGQPCADSFPVLVRWTSETGSLGVQNILMFKELSNCETKIDSITVYNTGRTPVDLIDVSITGTDNSLFRVLNPAVVTGVTLDSGEFTIVVIEFDPRGSTDGLKVAELVIRARIGNQPTPFVTQLSGTRLTSIPGSPQDVVFGAIDIQTTSSQIVTIVNNSSRIVHITSLSLRGTAGGVFTVNPNNVNVTLAPGERFDFTVSFTPLSQVAYVDSVLIAFDLPCPDEKAIEVTGIGKLNVEVTIILPEMLINPTDDNLSLPVRGKIVLGSVDSLTSTLKLTTQYQSQFFVAHSLSQGTITRNVVNAGITELEMEIPDIRVTKDETELFTINGQATIGSKDSTDMIITAAEFSGGSGSPTIRQDNGWLKLNICIAGGPRLIQRTGAQLTIDLQPTPSDENITISVDAFERGYHIIEMIDATGAKVFEHIWYRQNGDSPHLVNFDTKMISSGLYQVRLSTPTRQRFTTAVIVH